MQKRFSKVGEFLRSLAENCLPPADGDSRSGTTELLLEPEKPELSDGAESSESGDSEGNARSVASWESWRSSLRSRRIFSAEFLKMQALDKRRFRFTTGLLLLISIVVLVSVTSSVPTQTLLTTEGTDVSVISTAPAGPQVADAANLPWSTDPTAVDAAISPTANPRGEGSRVNNTSANGRVGDEGAGGDRTAPNSNGAANGKTPEGSDRARHSDGNQDSKGAANGQAPEGSDRARAAGSGQARDREGNQNGGAPGSSAESNGAVNRKAPEGNGAANGDGTGARDGDRDGTPPVSGDARGGGMTGSGDQSESQRPSDPFGLAEDLLKQTDMPPRTWAPLNRPAHIIYYGLAGTKEQPRLYITFDDGPHPVWTPRFLDLLDRYGARATFFLIGVHAVEYPHLVREIVERGHTLGNHLWSHTRAPFNDEELFRREVRNTAAELGEGITNCLRTPYGERSEQILAWSGEEGYELVLWSEPDIKDWKHREDIELLRETLAQIQKGGTILLLHEHTGANTLKALDEALASLTSRGWRVDTPICPLEF